MSKFVELQEVYTKQMKEKLGMKTVDADLLKAISKACGPSIYNKDAATVSCSDKTELERVKKNFLIKKLGLDDSPKLDEALKEVCTEMGSSNRSKYRPVFYYLLVQKFKKSAMFQ